MEQIKRTFDTAALIATMTNVIDLIPPVLTVISTTLAIVWYCIRIREYIKNKKVTNEH